MDAAPAHTVVDALGRELLVPRSPRRIVSLVPSLTELLADLGLDAQVVGLTTFCVRPAGWREAKARVGGTKQVSLQRVAALRPDLILANQEENTAADVAALSELAPVYVTRIAD
ncbi:MAG: ABC transporter substrate-binding protein, partial [Planctomycetes bacterium]|nr:ABC transporter substrate-binding protein [Planctomycetota bacterium]